MHLKTSYKLKHKITNHWHLVQPKSKTIRIRANDQGLIISFSNNIMINKFMWYISDNAATTISIKKSLYDVHFSRAAYEAGVCAGPRKYAKGAFPETM